MNYYISVVVMALVPAIILLWYVYKQDTIEKEPASLLGKLLLGGIASAGISYFLESISDIFIIIVSMRAVREVFVYTFLAGSTVALIEEGTKFFFLKLLSWKSKAFDYRFDGIVYAVFVSLGFAAVENILYVLEGGFSTAVIRGLISLPGHTSFAIIMGIYYGRAKEASGRNDGNLMHINLRKAYWLAVFFHASFDITLMFENDISLLLFAGVAVIMYSVLFVKLHKESQMDTVVDHRDNDEII